MPVPVVVQTKGDTSFRGSSPITLAFDSDNTVGNVLVLTGWARFATGTPTVTDTQGNTWVLQSAQPQSESGQVTSYVFICASCAGGPNTVSFNYAASGVSFLNSITEISGSTGVIDQIASGHVPSPSTPFDSGSITTTQPNSIIIAYFQVGLGGFSDPIIASPFTILSHAVTGSTYAVSGYDTSTGTLTINAEINQPGDDPAWIIFNLYAGAAPTTTDDVHNVDIDVMSDNSKSHNADLDVFIPPPVDMSHDADLYALVPPTFVHNADLYVLVPPTSVHSVDIFVNTGGMGVSLSFINLNSDVIPPITDPHAFVQLRASLANLGRNFLNLAGTIVTTNNRSFLNLRGTVVQKTVNYVKLAGTVSLGGAPTHNVDLSVAPQLLSFVQLAATLVQPLTQGGCGSFPDVSFVKLAAWVVDPAQSTQAPGTGLLPADDFNSSAEALSVYSAVSQIILDNINLIVTGFTVGVISYQTRTRTWLRRVDEAPSGILITTETQVRTLPTGQVITTVTTTEQNQDTTIVTVKTSNGNTPNLVQTTVTETTKTGKVTTREITTNNVNGIIHQEQKKTVLTTPPITDNVQPIKVTTLGGLQFYQFFGPPNQEWAGGDQEGLTDTLTDIAIIPGTLNGETHDQFGNPILAKTTTVTETDPSGKTSISTTTEIGTRRDVGTIVSDTESDFNGIQTTTHQTTTYPDGSTETKDTTTNNTTGDSVETDVEVSTDIYGTVTTTTTRIETKTFVDSLSGLLREQVTKTVTTQVDGVTINEVTSTVNNNFEDDIVNDKIRVYLIQEFTVTCIMDWQNMDALLEKQIQHQTQYALVELFGQQLGNAQLSFAFRQKLIQQFDAAANCMIPLKMTALGKTYDVVFAPSASAFRAKYIPGTQPHVYEVQFIVQERSNLINGTRQFG